MSSLSHKAILSAILSTLALYAPLQAEESLIDPSHPHKAIQTLPFRPFTGKVSGNKVRIRLQPTLDGAVLRESSKGEMLVVVGETEDFYAVKPPKDAKGYVYRTFILDNVVENNHVNVRLEPHTESAIVAQLNQGDRVQGNIIPNNAKWVEIALPETAHFYVSKEYIERVGDADLLTKMEQRREQVESLTKETQEQLAEEKQTPYEKSNFSQLKQKLETIVTQYVDFPEQLAQAKEALAKLQEDYLQKKLRHLEQESRIQAENLNNRSQQLEAQFSQKQKQLDERQKNIDEQEQINLMLPNGATPKMMAWREVEENLYNTWKEEHPDASFEDFYTEQREQATTLRGTVELYSRNIKNKPGDYMLVNAQKMPIAYLYSTQVNLEELLNHPVTLQVVPRPNNQFAFNAYYVLSVD